MILLRRYSLMFLTLLLIVPGVEAKSHKHRKHHKTHELTKVNDPHEEHNLRLWARRIDFDTRNLSPDDHVELVADQFHVPLSDVEDLQKQGQGWGNISISLAMADALSRKDFVHYPRPSDALFHIQAVHADAKSWTDIAQRTGIDLHPIVLATARSYKDVTARARAIPTLALATH